MRPQSLEGMVPSPHLLVEHGLGLATEARLLPVVAPLAWNRARGAGCQTTTAQGLYLPCSHCHTRAWGAGPAGLQCCRRHEAASYGPSTAATAALRVQAAQPASCAPCQASELLTLRVQAGLASLVLRDLHGHVLLARLAKGLLGLRDVHLCACDGARARSRPDAAVASAARRRRVAAAAAACRRQNSRGSSGARDSWGSGMPLLAHVLLAAPAQPKPVPCALRCGRHTETRQCTARARHCAAAAVCRRSGTATPALFCTCR